MAPKQLFLTKREAGDFPLVPTGESICYVRKDYILGVLRRERLDIRKKIADPRWCDERRELRTCEQVYSQFIYLLSKLT